MDTVLLSIVMAMFGIMISFFTLIYTIRALNIRERSLETSRLQNKIENLYKIKIYIDSKEIRKIRRMIYSLDLESTSINTMSDGNIQQIEQWGAEMDYISRLFHSGLIDRVGFFEIYADVVLRSAFLLSSFAMQRREERGRQYWIQFQKLVISLMIDWKSAQQAHTYPSEIKMPGGEKSISIQQLIHNEIFISFITNNGMIIKELDE